MNDLLTPLSISIFTLIICISAIINDLLVNKDILNPYNLVLFIIGMIYSYSIIDLILFRNINPIEGIYLTQISLWSLIGVIFFIGGYKFLVRMNINSNKVKVIPIEFNSYNKIQILLSSIAIIGIITLEIGGEGIIHKLYNPFSFKSTSEISWWVFYAQWGIFISHLVIWLRITYLIQSKKRIFNWYTIFLILLIGIISLAQNRYCLISFIIPIVYLYNYNIRRLGIFFWSFLSVIASIYFFLWDLFRNSILGKISDNDFTLLSIYDGLIANLDYVDTLLSLLNLQDIEKKIFLGSTYFTVFFKPIPRSLWPNKPLGANLLVTDLVMPGATDYGFSRAASILTEAYINFGWSGIPPIFFLVGCLTGRVYKIQNGNSSPKKTLVYAIFIIFILTLIRVDAQISTTFLVYYMLPLSTTLFYFKKKHNFFKFHYGNN